jgi:hypothetical protein
LSLGVWAGVAATSRATATWVVTSTVEIKARSFMLLAFVVMLSFAFFVAIVLGWIL